MPALLRSGGRLVSRLLRCDLCGGWVSFRDTGWRCGVCGKQWDLVEEPAVPEQLLVV